MTKQLVQVVNKVNNAAIRRVNVPGKGLFYVVPSYTMPDNCVMNGGFYPAEEIAASFETLNDTPAPVGHPYNENGEYIPANSPDGILFFQCGIFNKNVQRVSDDKYGHRVYVEKWVHVETAMQSERGKRVIEAIDSGAPIHSSTGIVLESVPEIGVNAQGKKYTWRATNMTFDHDAILLDEEGAATPEDGVGLLVNKQLLTQINRQGATMTVNSARLNANQSFNDLREQLQAEVQQRFGEANKRIWLMDFGEDYAVFELDETPYKVGYTTDGENITLDSEAQEVKRVTMWEAVTNSIKGFFNRGNSATTTNQEGDDMFKQHIENALKANKIDYSKMTDEQKMEAYDALKGNAAEQPVEPKGEQEPAQGEKVVNAYIQKLVADTVAQVIAANAKAAEKAERDEIEQTLAANKSPLTRETQDKMTLNELHAVVNTFKRQSAYGLPAGQMVPNHNESRFSDELPE